MLPLFATVAVSPRFTRIILAFLLLGTAAAAQNSPSPGDHGPADPVLVDPGIKDASKFDANGSVGFANVPVGTYWVVTEIRYNNKSYVWNLRIDVRPGSNAVSLDHANWRPMSPTASRWSRWATALFRGHSSSMRRTMRVSEKPWTF